MKTNRIARRMGALVLCAALTAGALSVAAGAAQSGTVTAGLHPEYTILVDGTARTFTNVHGEEVYPIGELMGKNVNWDQSTHTVSLTGPRTASATRGTPDDGAAARTVSVELHPEYTILVDGVERTFTDVNGDPVYPMAYGGSVYLPIRAIGSLMGKDVDWNGDTHTVILSGGSEITDADSFHQSGTQTGALTAERAKEIALDHAGLSASQVTFIRAELDRDDGRLVYDVEFYTADYKEYDYEIDASTGAVLSYDYDAEHYDRPSGSQSGAAISEARARELALAQVPGASESNIRKVELDRDDGRLEYEVEIVYNHMEYDFDIDASTGTILSRDVESVWD